jgi:hypothetical protein
MGRTRYEWEFAFVDAILEYDPRRATAKVSRARVAMNDRLEELPEIDESQWVGVERRAILNGLVQLTIHLNRIAAA